MGHLIFVYGTLKEGFCNHPINAGLRVPGEFVTSDPYPLYIIGRWYLPWLLDARTGGHPVSGQLFEVTPLALARMDELERISEANWYSRGDIWIHERGCGQTSALKAQVYFGAAARLDTEQVHAGPIGEFTLSHDAEYRARGA